jgi:Ca2+-binding RTX toxin-like protein
VFADQVNQHSDATGTTVQFVFNNGLVPLGFHGPSSMTLVSGEWQVGGAAGNNLWFGSDSTASVFNAAAGASDGNDILIGGAASEAIHAGNGWNFVDGGAGNDYITSGSGNDILHGGRGYDYLAGGSGNDAYAFNRGDAADVVFDSGGTDSLDLGPGIRIADVALQFSGNDLIVGVRDASNPDAAFSSLADRITLLNWQDPLDRIETLRFADGTALNLAAMLRGSSGDDVLDGGPGANVMLGGAGNDTYVVNNPGDLVSENAGEGADVVSSSITYMLGYSIEGLLLNGGAAINGTGNSLANVIAGNDANNTLAGAGGGDTLYGHGGNDVLDGGAGADAMLGGSGDDAYAVDNIADMVVENAGEGNDTVWNALIAANALFAAGRDRHSCR